MSDHMDGILKKFQLEASQQQARRDLLKGLVDIHDDLLALERTWSGDDQGAAGPGKSIGIQRLKLDALLQKNGVRAMNAVGAPLDLSVHEVHSVADMAPGPEEVVVEEMQRGYWIDDEILRRALVVVSPRGAEPVTNQAPTQDSNAQDGGGDDASSRN